MTVTDRTAATDAEFRSRIAPFESATTPPEVVEARVVEEVALAILRADYPDAKAVDDEIPEWQRLYRDRAAAAVAAYRAAQDGGAEEAVRRVEAVADDLEASHPRTMIARPEREMGRLEGADAERLRIASRLRAALAPQAGEQR